MRVSAAIYPELQRSRRLNRPIRHPNGQPSHSQLSVRRIEMPMGRIFCAVLFLSACGGGAQAQSQNQEPFQDTSPPLTDTPTPSSGPVLTHRPPAQPATSAVPETV